MSYAMTAALQSAVYTALSSDLTLMEAVGGSVYDSAPEGRVPDLFVALGTEQARNRSDATVSGALHDLAVTVISDAPGFLSAKQAAARISDILNEADLALDRGRLVRIRFVRALARLRSGRREIEIWFRAFVEDAAPA